MICSGARPMTACMNSWPGTGRLRARPKSAPGHDAIQAGRQGTQGGPQAGQDDHGRLCHVVRAAHRTVDERARPVRRRFPHPRATSLSMLDGAVAAVVAGPVSMAPEEWVCPLLGVDPPTPSIRDAEELTAIATTLMRHNAISETLSTRPESFEPLFVQSSDGEVDPQPWCMGFYAVMKVSLLVWSRLFSSDRTEHTLLRPILIHCVDDAGRPPMPPATRSPGTPGLARHQHR